eukprot:751284-Hanusia_phi.AAC.2
MGEQRKQDREGGGVEEEEGEEKKREISGQDSDIDGGDQRRRRREEQAVTEEQSEGLDVRDPFRSPLLLHHLQHRSESVSALKVTTPSYPLLLSSSPPPRPPLLSASPPGPFSCLTASAASSPPTSRQGHRCRSPQGDPASDPVELQLLPLPPCSPLLHSPSPPLPTSPSTPWYMRRMAGGRGGGANGIPRATASSKLTMAGTSPASRRTLAPVSPRCVTPAA